MANKSVFMPYSNSKARPEEARGRIRKTLKKFGVDRISFDEDFRNHAIYVCFKYRNYPVSIPVNYGALALNFLKQEPYNSRRRCSREEYEEKKREIAYRAAFSILEDFIKSMVTMVEIGIFSFEEIFVAYFVDQNGRRLGELFKKRLPELIGGQHVLFAGE